VETSSTAGDTDGEKEEEILGAKDDVIGELMVKGELGEVREVTGGEEGEGCDGAVGEEGEGYDVAETGEI
jgi:hypothetical protein